MPTDRECHFDIGDSTAGPLGLCAVVCAITRDAALRRLKEALPTEVDMSPTHSAPASAGIEYIRLYVEPTNITVDDIIDVSPDEDPDEDPVRCPGAGNHIVDIWQFCGPQAQGEIRQLDALTLPVVATVVDVPGHGLCASTPFRSETLYWVSYRRHRWPVRWTKHHGDGAWHWLVTLPPDTWIAEWEKK